MRPDEDVIAVGRAEVRASKPRKRADVRGSFVLVTESRLLWTDMGPRAHVEELRFEDVTAAVEQMDTHRVRVTIRHRPLDRLAHVPAYHVWFIAGGDRYALMRFDETRLMFSRPTTEAAVALRDRLLAHGIPITQLPPVPRLRSMRRRRLRLRRATRPAR